MSARKLFVVTRSDLSEGQQSVQGMHAAIEFTQTHLEETRLWFKESNTLAFLVAENEERLGVLYRKAIDSGVPVVAFREPDRDNELTAIAIGPSGKKLTQGLKLAHQKLCYA
jgi:peptidyl-tRNA hydrolase